MKLKPWIHSALHIGCVALLLLQGHYIWQLRREVVEESAREIRVTCLPKSQSRDEQADQSRCEVGLLSDQPPRKKAAARRGRLHLFLASLYRSVGRERGYSVGGQAFFSPLVEFGRDRLASYLILT
jgi:hypothetical protein